MIPKDLSKLLTAPFPEKDIEWRVGRSGVDKNGKPWAQLFAYTTARAVHDRLDQVVGPENWRVEYQIVQIGDKPGVLAGLSIRFVEDGRDPFWVTKWDGAEPTEIESVKGALSDATKRAAAIWGIGRYLYQLDNNWAEFSDRAPNKLAIKRDDGTKLFTRWSSPALPDWAKP